MLAYLLIISHFIQSCSVRACSHTAIADVASCRNYTHGYQSHVCDCDCDDLRQHNVNSPIEMV